MQTIVVNMEAVNCGARERLYPYINDVVNNNRNNNNNDNNRYYQTEWQTGDDGMNKVSNYRVSDFDDDDDAATVKRRNIINKLTSDDDNQNFESLLSALVSGISGNDNKLMKRSYFYEKNNINDIKSKRESFPSAYPEIMTDLGNKNLLNEKPFSPLDGAANSDLNYNSLLNQLNQLQTSGQLASFTNANSGRVLSTVDDNNNGSGGGNDGAKANKLTFKADGGRETADNAVSETGTYAFSNEHLILWVKIKGFYA